MEELLVLKILSHSCSIYLVHGVRMSRIFSWEICGYFEFLLDLYRNFGKI